MWSRSSRAGGLEVSRDYTFAASPPPRPKLTEEAAALLIQRSWRGFVGRWFSLQKRAVETAAVELIQEAWRRCKQRRAQAERRLLRPPPVPRPPLTRDTAAVAIQKHVRGALARRLIVVVRTRALLRHSLAALPGAHAAGLKQHAGSTTAAVLDTFAARCAVKRRNLPPVPPGPALGARLCALYRTKGEAAALDEARSSHAATALSYPVLQAAREALYWSSWLLPPSASPTELSAHQAAHRALGDTLGRLPPGTHSVRIATELSAREATETVADVYESTRLTGGATLASLARGGAGVAQLGPAVLPTVKQRQLLEARFKRASASAEVRAPADKKSLFGAFGGMLGQWGSATA